MPYDIEWEQRGVIKYFSGVVLGRDLLASEEEITSHPDYPELRYVVSVYVAAERMAATLEERTSVRALRLGGYATNPHIKFAFATTDPVIRRNIESSVEGGEALHRTRVFDSFPAALLWATSS